MTDRRQFLKTLAALPLLPYLPQEYPPSALTSDCLRRAIEKMPYRSVTWNSELKRVGLEIQLEWGKAIVGEM